MRKRLLFFPRWMLLAGGVLLFSIANGQSDKGSEGAIDIEVRIVQYEANRSVANGSIPDSLDMKYFVHENGGVYKHFPRFEMLYAHYSGSHYPRPLATVEEETVYLTDWSDVRKFDIELDESKSTHEFRFHPDKGEMELID